MSALEIPEVDEAVFTEDEDDYDDEEGKIKTLVYVYLYLLKRY